MGQNRVVGAASFLLDMETGTFNVKATEAERTWAQTTANMSEHTLKVNSAQIRLRETLAKYPNDVQRVNRATIALMAAQREAATATHATTSALHAEARGLGRLERGALVGSGALRGLGRSAAFASTAFIGGAGFVYALRSSIKAAEDHQVVQKQLGAAVRAAGLQFGGYRKQIEETLRSLRLLSGFTEEDTAKSFTTLVRGTKNVAEALKLEALAANVARGRNIELSQATMIVIKAHIGMAGQLRRLGLDVDKHATALQLIAKLTQVYGGSVAAFTKTAAGSQARFTQAVYETKVAVGTALLPTVTKYLDAGTKWLDQSKNQARVTRDVKEAVKVAGTAIHVLAQFIQGATTVIKPLVGALGGMESALKLALSLTILSRLGLLRLGLRGVGAEAAVAAGGVRGLRRGLLSIPTTIGVAITVDYILGKQSQRLGSFLKDRLPGVFGKDSRTISRAELIAGARSGKYSLGQLEAFRALGATGADVDAAENAVPGHDRNHPRRGTYDANLGSRSDATGTTSAGDGRPAPLSATIPPSLLRNEARASATYGPDSSQERAALNAEKDYLTRALKDKRQSVADQTALYNQLESVNGQLQSIQNKGDVAAKRHDKAMAKKKKERDAAHDKQLADNAAYNIARINDRGKEFAALMKGRKYQGGRGSGSFDAERFFLEQQSSFFGSFGSNDFTQSTKGGRTRRSPGAKDAATVVVNQHFPAMTTDRHREARLAYNAYRAQFDG